MNEQDVTAFDLERMFIGDFSLWFLLEVAFRTAVMFVYTVGLVRALGKRGMRQLTPLELVIIIALGSAVGDPMFYADVPLLHGMVVVTVIVALEVGLAKATGSSERVERMIDSAPTLVVKDGQIDVEALAREGLGCDELLAALREAGFDNLGDVRLAYFEPSGNVSSFRETDAEPPAGLSLLPEDLEGTGASSSSEWLACRRCGALVAGSDRRQGCHRCGPGTVLLPAADRGGRMAAKPPAA
jgi:uncharacterized membrane protein YcaP (DUF421 family)